MKETGNHYEGEVTGYDSNQKVYKIRYTNGLTEDYGEIEMKKHYKHLQRYSKAKFRKGSSRRSSYY